MRKVKAETAVEMLKAMINIVEEDGDDTLTSTDIPVLKMAVDAINEQIARKNEMTRDEMHQKLVEMAKRITGRNSEDWTRDAERAIWKECLEWNNTHEDDQILMCDYESEDGEVGFCIEDDYFIVG